MGNHDIGQFQFMRGLFEFWVAPLMRDLNDRSLRDFGGLC